MSDPFREQPVSPRALLCAALLVGFALFVTAGSRLTNVGVAMTPQAQPVQSRVVKFSDGDDGSVLISAIPGVGTVYVVPPGDGGFVRGVLRGMGRERKLRGIGPEQPYQLTQWNNGRLSLGDPMTAVSVDLGSFGADNEAAFTRILDAVNREQGSGPEVSLSR